MTRAPLFVSVACPPRRKVATRFGSCQAPTLLGPIVERQDLIRWAGQTIPAAVARCEINDGHVLAILGNIEGVMDVFAKRREWGPGDESEWDRLEARLGEMSVALTAKLIAYFLGANLPDQLDPTGPIEIGERCTLVSLRDFDFPFALKNEFAAAGIASSSGATLVQQFSDAPIPEEFNAMFFAAKDSLRDKCPFFSEEELSSQTLRIRYAQRRAVGALADAWARRHCNQDAEFVAFRADELDAFQVDLNGLPHEQITIHPEPRTLEPERDAALTLALLLVEPVQATEFDGATNRLFNRAFGRARDLREVVRQVMISTHASSAQKIAGARVGLLNECALADVRVLPLLARRTEATRALIGESGNARWWIGDGVYGDECELDSASRLAVQAAGFDAADARRIPSTTTWWVDAICSSRRTLPGLATAAASGSGLPWDALELAALMTAAESLWPSSPFWKLNADLEGLAGPSVRWDGKDLRTQLMLCPDDLVRSFNTVESGHPLELKEAAVSELLRRFETTERAARA